MIAFLVAIVCLFILAVDWIVLDRARFSLGTLLKAMTLLAVVWDCWSIWPKIIWKQRTNKAASASQ